MRTITSLRAAVVVTMVWGWLGVSLLGGMGWAGMLEPPAAAVDGSGNPVATGDLHSWDKKLNAANGPQIGRLAGCFSERFTCIFPDENGNYTAVRDNETGLVWDRAPDTNTRNWSSAITYCADRAVGGRKGWGLPMREQLATLVDTSNSNPFLPAGHPFLNVLSAFYWSASTNATSPAIAWGVGFGTGGVILRNKANDNLPAWCVRGGQVFDGNTHDTLH